MTPRIDPRIEAVERIAEQMPREDRLTWFESLPEEVQDAFFAALADECAEHLERQRLAGPDEVEWHRRPRVGRLWNVPKYARPIPHSSANQFDGDPDDVLHTIEPRTYVELLTGEHVPRLGMIPCPLPDHDDRTPSFKVYETPERGVWCFGCHRGGDIYCFAAELWSMDTRRDFRELRRGLASELLARSVG